MAASLRPRHPARPAFDGSPLQVWVLLGAVLAMLGLLLALGTVVQQVVRQAEARHIHTAARADANWRCGTLPGRGERDQCRQRASELPVRTAATGL